MGQMMDDGFVTEAWRQYLREVVTIECVAELQKGVAGLSFDETFSLTLEDVWGIFVLHIILSSVSVLLALFQFFYYNKGKVRQRNILQVFGVQQLHQTVVRARNLSLEPKGTSADFFCNDDSVLGSPRNLLQ
jgi:hypothetical protein